MPYWLGQAKVAASGKAHVLVQHENPSVKWIVEQISLNLAIYKAGATATITVDSEESSFFPGYVVCPTNFLTQTSTFGMGATAAGEPYLYIGATENIAVWCDGCTPNDLLTVRAQYRELMRNDIELRGR